MACFSGPDPLDTEADRMAIWKWAKAPSGIDPKTGLETGGGIDEGRSFQDVHEAINRYFYAGMAKPDWITEKLAGRKTPLKPFVLAARTAEYRRRLVTAQAKELTEAIQKQQKQGPLYGGLGKLFDAPRALAVKGHGVVFPITHAGDLAFQPQNMKLFFGQLFKTWGHAFPLETAKMAAKREAAVEQMLTNMKANPLHDLAIAAKLDIGERSRGGNLTSGKSGPSERAWSLLKITRFKMWEKEMNLVMKREPTMTEEQKLKHGKELAEMANHATGTGGGWVAKVPGLFGPALTASKWARLSLLPSGDIGKTFNALTNRNATPEARYVAMRRLRRATYYLGTLGSSLALNAGINKAFFHVKDEDNVNFFDPTKADWMSFKTGGLEWSVPGLHSELKFLAGIVAISAQQFWDQKEINKKSRGLGQWGELRKLVGQYALNKLAPGGQILGEVVLGADWQGRPMPWVNRAGTEYAPPYGFNPKLKGPAHYADAALEYALSHAPIPFTAPIKYIYDELRAKGANAFDATATIRGLIMAGMGFTGLHAQPEPPAKAAAKH